MTIFGDRVSGLGPSSRSQSHRRAMPLTEVLEGRRLLATITVNTTGDADEADGSSTLSLRQAIEISNGTLAIGSLTMAQSSLVSGPLSSINTIDFAIPGTGPFVISPTSSLPAISSVVIDGYSQPGSHPNTNGPGQGKNTVLQIELDGSQAGSSAVGLNVGEDSTVEGLAIGGFAIGLSIGGIMGNLSDNLVEGNFIGTDVTGTRAFPNDEGITMYVGPYGSGGFNTIGGTAAGAGNVISGNTGNGVTYGNSCLIEGNFIGTDISGAEPLPNGGQAIAPAVFYETFDSMTQIDYATDVTIGGTVAGAGNVFLESHDNDAVTSAVVGQSGTLISATLVANPSTTVTVDFFASPSGLDQNRTDLGSTVVSTDASGHASFSFFSTQALHGQAITFSKTDSNGNTTEYASSFTASDMTTTELVGPGQVATLGQATTFAAVVGATAGGVPTGVVDFLQAGVVIGSAPLNASGIAVFITKGLSAGPQMITAAYMGDPTHATSQSDAVAVSVFASRAFGGPAVTSVTATGSDRVTIAFNRGLMPGPADDTANYKIVGPGHHPMTVEAAVYNPTTNTVTLTTLEDLTPNRTYQLTIQGETGDRVLDVFGIPLNGQKNGKPGHDYVGKFTVKKAPVVKVAHRSGPKAHATSAKKSH